MKKLINKLFYPKDNIILLGVFVIIFSLIYLIGFSKFGTFLSYILYLLMTYSLIIICIKIYNILNKKINLLIDNNKYLRKYKNDYKLRYKISLTCSLLFNIIYVIFKFISGIYFKSIWFISFALYYLLLVIMKANIMKEELNENKNLKLEYIKYRNTAIIILFINMILTMIILVIVNQKIINIYPVWLAISSALYTFYLNFISIYNLIKYRKFKSPLMSSAKVINVITSLVSLISLEVILIPTFGVNNMHFFEVMITLTGLGISIIIVIISLYMIINSTEWLKESK